MSSVRNYNSYLFRDPLLHPTYLSNERVGTPIVLTNKIDINVEGDHLLNLFINQLDEEIFSIIPDGLGDLGEAIWIEDKWTDLAVKIANESRKHGWCLVQFYEDNSSIGRWRVFSVNEFSQWLKEEDADGKLVKTGIKFVWSDDLGNSFNEDILFEDAHLCKWREGNGMSVFAFPDLSQAIMTLAFEFRQMRGQLTFSAAKPSFKHFLYGDAADDDNINQLDLKLKGIDNSAGIGAPVKVLQEIKTIKNEALSIIEPALDKQLQYYSGVTRLPIAFYIGERNTSSGLNAQGEITDMLKIRLKQEEIFNVIAPTLRNIFRKEYGIETDPQLKPNTTLEEIKFQKPSETDEQTDQGTDSDQENN